MEIKSLSLYGLTQEFASVQNEIMSSINDDGEVDMALVERLDAIQVPFNEKCLQVAYIIKKLRDDKELIKKQIEYLKELERRVKANEEKLATYLSENMQQVGVDKVENYDTKISFRRSEKTIVDNESLLEERFRVVVTETKIDLNAIKKAIKSGEEVQGCHLETNMNIQIK